MTEKTIKPEIRFSEFNNSWEQRKLGEITNSYSGGTPSVGIRSYYGGDIPFIRSGEINSDLTELFVTQEGLQKSSAKLVNKGDVLYALYGATSGEVGIARISGAINQAILALKPHLNFDSHFVSYWLRKEKSKIISTYLQGGQGNLSGNIVKELVIKIPTSFDEQYRIGIFFKELDNLITLHQQKCDMLVIIKKSMLQQMFPKQGKYNPEIRFVGFIEAWELRKLGELCDVYDGTHQTPNYQKSGIMFLSVENIKSLKSEKYISEEDFIKDFNIFPEKDDVLMTRIGDIGTANVVDSNEPKAYYVSLALLKKKLLDPYFLKESIFSETVKNDLWKRTLHIAFPKKINKNEIAEVLIPYPEKREEQELIGMFFKNLDNLITLQQSKLEKIRNIKKSLLEKMFVSEV